VRFFIVLLFITLYGYASIGYISAMRGNVYLEREKKISKAFKGLKLESRDVIRTDRKSKAQIIFKDGTVVRIGKETEFRIEEYMFNKKGKSKVRLRVNKGFFNTLTGKIPHKQFKFFTRTSTIGIRGTHFQGVVQDDKEDIACLRGAIVVEVGDKTFDVLAGEIINIKAGIPSMPRRFKTIDIDNMEDKNSLEKKINSINTQISDLSKIKNSDIKYTQYSKTIEEVSKLEQEFLEENFYKTPMILKTSSGDTELGFYTKKRVAIDESDTLEEKLQKVEDAEVEQVAFKTNSEAKESDVPTTPFWDGTSQGGKIKKYNGQVVFIGNLQSDDKRTDLTENGVQPITLELDTQNRFTSGEFKYYDSDIKFSNSGKGAVEDNHFMFYSNNILESGDKEIVMVQNQNGYSGDDIYSYIAFVDRGFFSKDIETYLKTGGFIADKVDEIDIKKKSISADDIFSWGYWAYQDNGKEKIRGAWLINRLNITPQEKIDEYREQSVKAQYSGEIFGTVENSVKGLEAEEIENGHFNAEIDFNKKTISGNLEFSSEQTQQRNIAFEAKNAIDGNSITFNETTSNLKDGTFTIKNEDAPLYMYGSGKLYGEDAQNIGGGFNAGFENGDTVIAGFKGSKK